MRCLSTSLLCYRASRCLSTSSLCYRADTVREHGSAALTCCANTVWHLKHADRVRFALIAATHSPKANVLHASRREPWSSGRTGWAWGNESDQADRAISTGKLRVSPRFHIQPINVVVYYGSQGRTRFQVGFPLRCLQRLSRPYVATLQCGWRHNRSTRGTSTPVLSY